MRYAPDVIAPDDERDLMTAISKLELQPFAFGNYLGNRRTASFGWRYDFRGGGFQKAAPIPGAFLPFRQTVAAFAGVSPESLEHLLVIEYPAGAGIGWHRDNPQFGIVAALSLVGSCRMRFRQRAGGAWQRTSLDLPPRSAYVLDGPARSEWEHSIRAVDAPRYSLTFRTLSGKQR
jgi:alkylated DNA repair dioxygenase AlkB